MTTELGMVWYASPRRMRTSISLIGADDQGELIVGPDGLSFNGKTNSLRISPTTVSPAHPQLPLLSVRMAFVLICIIVKSALFPFLNTPSFVFLVCLVLFQWLASCQLWVRVDYLDQGGISQHAYFKDASTSYKDLFGKLTTQLLEVIESEVPSPQSTNNNQL